MIRKRVVRFSLKDHAQRAMARWRSNLIPSRFDVGHSAGIAGLPFSNHLIDACGAHKLAQGTIETHMLAEASTWLPFSIIPPERTCGF
jgi:hypothetical protein